MFAEKVMGVGAISNEGAMKVGVLSSCILFITVAFLFMFFLEYTIVYFLFGTSFSLFINILLYYFYVLYISL